ncbi:MAG: hypothetical protein A2W69_04545 [Gammaproteobacteria bacterium RIFCSPLOWO2_02_47_7]|nr:MAG: hypothetical protein A2W69_04545 [Gammaproteobacteria bacterium RIFCSPLOWO2_02_47_7]
MLGKLMKNPLTIFLIIILNICGCSDNNDTQEKKDHVWKEQTEAIEKAKAVEGMLRDSAEEQRRQIMEQSE